MLFMPSKLKSKWFFSLRHRKFDFINYTYSHSVARSVVLASRPIWLATDCVHFFVRFARDLGTLKTFQDWFQGSFCFITPVSMISSCQ